MKADSSTCINNNSQPSAPLNTTENINDCPPSYNEAMKAMKAMNNKHSTPTTPIYLHLISNVAQTYQDSTEKNYLNKVGPVSGRAKFYLMLMNCSLFLTSMQIISLYANTAFIFILSKAFLEVAAINPVHILIGSIMLRILPVFSTKLSQKAKSYLSLILLSVSCLKFGIMYSAPLACLLNYIFRSHSAEYKRYSYLVIISAFCTNVLLRYLNINSVKALMDIVPLGTFTAISSLLIIASTIFLSFLSLLSIYKAIFKDDDFNKAPSTFLSYSVFCTTALFIINQFTNSIFIKFSNLLKAHLPVPRIVSAELFGYNTTLFSKDFYTAGNYTYNDQIKMFFDNCKHDINQTQCVALFAAIIIFSAACYMLYKIHTKEVAHMVSEEFHENNNDGRRKLKDTVIKEIKSDNAMDPYFNRMEKQDPLKQIKEFLKLDKLSELKLPLIGKIFG